MSRRSSRADRNLRLVTSHVHPGQPCQPCILCKKDNQSKYFHPKSWKDASLLDCLKQYEPWIQSCIRRLCRNELNKVKDITNTGFVPRWRKSNKGITKSCAIPECANTAQKITKLANRSIFFNWKWIWHSLVMKGYHYVLNTMVHGTGTQTHHINGAKHAARTLQTKVVHTLNPN